MWGKSSQSRRYEDFECGYALSKWHSIRRETNGFAARFMHGASITKCSIGKHCLPAYNVMHIQEALLLLGQVCNYWRRLVSEFAELLTLINIVIPPDSVTPIRLSRSGAFYVCLLTRMSPVRNFGKLGEWLRGPLGYRSGSELAGRRVQLPLGYIQRALTLEGWFGSEQR